ncbi:UDP-3-O-(3-hydroxymyristoyl)glucosamine N-acyltransferase [Methylobrevis pamukkalensis]|uniref:UDP-3-O-acylglucosamine N-acyltransferase n=1 Tax=Methylobrevis pamukkalensis TaxID=1439726 RepID=A0A1E3H4B0_9HYPH|nr:UDP-3-O-(3-hydroxymyristoyl)glucosamine N-acyltransferase [Methylobrevis pamukkalensis]ODN71150.1 UDP-3-O-acylglucosamine N-acyltransferase [Methylobrevis pamukkalensis]
MPDPVFFRPARTFTVAEIAALVKGRVAAGDPEAVITGVAPLSEAGEGQLTFLDNPRYLADFRATRATACICGTKYAAQAPEGVAMIVAASPYRASAMVVQALFPDATRLTGAFGNSGIHPAAVVHPDARLEDGVCVEPGAVIGPRAEIGSGTVICANAVIGHDVRIGRDGYVGAGATVMFALVGNRVIIHPGVRIGQDGFGFAMGPSGHMKVPQIGRVAIQDDVEIGANTTIDRGANRDTIIGEGTKIDNGVQIGHNVVVGRHCVIVSQSGISGSSTLGDFVALGGQAGISGHLRIGTGAQVAGNSGVASDIPAGEKWGGSPAMPLRQWMKGVRTLRKLAAKAVGDGDSD